MSRHIPWSLVALMAIICAAVMTEQYLKTRAQLHDCRPAASEVRP